CISALSRVSATGHGTGGCTPELVGHVPLAAVGQAGDADDVLVAQVHEPVEGPVPPRPKPYTPTELREAEAARKSFLSR
ncbi:MAG: hypothetical protein QF351_00370, partial [Phycisphaerales bacterium]|nr:hypothetical protein [Phycisphaerales bacterium]